MGHVSLFPLFYNALFNFKNFVAYTFFLACFVLRVSPTPHRSAVSNIIFSYDFIRSWF